MTSRKTAVACGGNDPAKTKTNTMPTQTTITASTAPIRCSLALICAPAFQKRNKWDFNPSAAVRKDGTTPTLRHNFTHRIGETSNIRVKREATAKIAELRDNKNKTKQILALRAMTTATEKRCTLNPNGKLKIGNRYANKAEQAQFSALL